LSSILHDDPAEAVTGSIGLAPSTQLRADAPRSGAVSAYVLNVLRHGSQSSAVNQLLAAAKVIATSSVAAGNSRTASGLAHQFSNRLEKVDVVAGQVVDPLEGGECWPLQ
jgi:hypothetical protein